MLVMWLVIAALVISLQKCSKRKTKILWCREGMMLTSLIGERFSITEYHKVKYVNFHEDSGYN